MQGMLAFENAPPFVAPLRFFITAPLFGSLAGLLLAWAGADLLASRWMPDFLAATHLLTVGFMLQVMVGALIQILPVVAGASLAHPVRVSRFCHVGLTLGALSLAFGFFSGQPIYLQSAALVLGGTVAYFLFAAGTALLAVPTTSPTTRGLKLALIALLAVVSLGVVMALALAFGWALPLPALADLHAGWGLGGWAGVLLAAVAYVVVPMFQLTPGYPARPSWWFPPLMLAALSLWSAAPLLGWPLLEQLGRLALVCAGVAFTGLTLRLQGRRRRARADATYRYWQCGLISCCAALVMLLLAGLWPALSDWPFWTPLFGILLVIGGFVSFIAGMLYKIVPFLAWMHLQNAGMAKVPAPPMNKLLPDKLTQQQFMVHALACGLLLLALFWPVAGRLAGLAFAVSQAWLAWNLVLVLRRYRDHLALIATRLEVVA